MSAAREPRPDEAAPRARLRSPLLLVLWVLLAFETVGGLLLFVSELAWGRRPGETLHVVAGVPLTGVYAVYQWRHWRRVSRLRARPDYLLGILAGSAMALTVLSGWALGGWWWHDRVRDPVAGEVDYPALLTAVHDIGAMLALAFIGAHLTAARLRDRGGPEHRR